MEVEFSQAEAERYSRQLALGGFGSAAQGALKQARVAVIGAGPAGVAAASQLAAAGVGYLGVVDGGRIQLADLAGQATHYTPDVGASKAESAASKLGVLNPDVQVDSYPVNVGQDNCEAILIGHELVLAGDQDRTTRRLINEVALALGVTLIDFGAGDRHAALQTVRPGEQVCLACTCDQEPDFGPAFPGLAASVGALAAMEAVKLLTGIGTPLEGRLVIDVDRGHVKVEQIACEPDCDCKQSAIGVEVS